MSGNTYKCSVCLLMLVTLIAPRLHAQTWDELFSQNKTQKKYLLEQIAALQVFTGYLKKGYEIVGSGLETVRSLSSAELSMRSGYLTALKLASPLIIANPKAREILAMQLSISKIFKSMELLALPVAWQDYVSSVKRRIYDECDADREQLSLALASGVEMTDDQRISRVENLYESTSDKLAFSQSFHAQLQLLLAQRNQDNKSLENLIRIYGNPKD